MTDDREDAGREDVGHDDSAELIHLVSREAGTAQIRFGDCETVVTLRVFTDGTGVTQVAQSHWIKTSDNARAHKPQGFSGPAARGALGAAIGELAFHFDRALQQGRRPEESWFVPMPMLVGAD
jgi:hypothetical protein